MVGDRNGLIEVIGVDDDDEEDDKVGEGNGIGSSVVDCGKVEEIDVATEGSSIITSKVSEMFSRVTFLICILDFCAFELMLLLERLNSLCSSCTICRSRSFSLYCSSVPDLQINKVR